MVKIGPTTEYPADLMSRRIAILAFDGISTFHLSVPYTVFGENRADIGIPAYQVSLCAVTPGVIRTSMGLETLVSKGVEEFSGADMVIVPSWRDVDSPIPGELAAALSDAHRNGTVIVGLCLGAFVLAGSGLLDGRSATTHWRWAEKFSQQFPKVTLDSKVLYVDHGDVITSAGTAASLDCCLHLLRKDVGAELANRLAKRLVIPPHRQGSQAQFVEQPVYPKVGTNRVAQTLEWARERLREELNIDTLARQSAMSRRTFTRHFQKMTGMTVVQWLTNQRLFHAQRMLETSELSIEHIALNAGFGTALSMRLAFLNNLNTTPSRYRKEFGRRRPNETA